jgi:hypothetical protein
LYYLFQCACPRKCERGFAYGIFNTVYGGAWFAGSIAIGALYMLGTVYAAAFMIMMQCAALPVLWETLREQKRMAGRTAGT